MNRNRQIISRYLDGELDKLTASRFEEELKNDPLLQKELDFYRQVGKALRDTQVVDLRMQLQDLHEQLNHQKQDASRRRVRWLVRTSAAASITLLAAIAGLGLLRHNSLNYLVEKNYSPYEITSINRSGETDADVALRMAFEKYMNKDYAQAVVLFEKVLKEDPGQIASRFYSGISYYEISEYSKAGKSFNNVIEHNDNLYIEQARWYLGFCYLKMKEPEKAKIQFRWLADSKGYYSEKAGKILKKLK